MNAMNVPEFSLERLYGHISRMNFSLLTEENILRTKLTLADILGCIVGGWRDEGARIFGDYMAEMGGVDHASLWGRSEKLPAPNAAAACAVAARAFDYGVVESNAPGTFDRPLHGSETTVPVALAMAEKSDISGKELLASIALGEDLIGRLTGAISFDKPQIDCRGSLNSLAATAIAANILKLSPEKCHAALGLALHGLNGVKQGIHFSLGQGFSAKQGIVSAELAEKGLYGVYNTVEELSKIAAHLNASFDAHLLFDDLGSSFYSAMTYKPWPSCRATHGAIECGFELLEKGVTADSIEKITLKVSPWTAKHLVSRPFNIREYPHTDGTYSIIYALANVLLREKCTPECYLDEQIKDKEIALLARKITLSSSEWPFMEGDVFLSTAVEVTLKTGESVHSYVQFPKGHEYISTPIPIEEKKKKFIENLLFGANISAEKADSAYRMIMDMENLQNIKPLADILRP